MGSFLGGIGVWLTFICFCAGRLLSSLISTSLDFVDRDNWGVTHRHNVRLNFLPLGIQKEGL